jgi:streptogramin lyase
LNCRSEEKEITLSVKGQWNPVTGEVELYHYDEGEMPHAAMVDKYLWWVVDEAARPIRPAP